MTSSHVPFALKEAIKITEFCALRGKGSGVGPAVSVPVSSSWPCEHQLEAAARSCWRCARCAHPFLSLSWALSHFYPSHGLERVSASQHSQRGLSLEGTGLTGLTPVPEQASVNNTFMKAGCKQCKYLIKCSQAGSKTWAHLGEIRG